MQSTELRICLPASKETRQTFATVVRTQHLPRQQILVVGGNYSAATNIFRGSIYFPGWKMFSRVANILRGNMYCTRQHIFLQRQVFSSLCLRLQTFFAAIFVPLQRLCSAAAKNVRGGNIFRGNNNFPRQSFFAAKNNLRGSNFFCSAAYTLRGSTYFGVSKCFPR